MEFMLMIIDNEETLAATPDADVAALLDRHKKFGDELHAANAWVTSQRLRTGAHAATVRRRGGKSVVVDGPFAESKEVLGGFYLIDVDSMEDAIEWAKQLPTLPGSAVEVRPVWGTVRERRWAEK